MNISPATHPYEFEHSPHHIATEERLPSIKRIFESINNSATRSEAVLSQALSPPDLLHDSDEDDADSLGTPSVSSSPQQAFMSREHDLLHHRHSSCNSYERRRKSTPHRSPSAIHDSSFSTADKSVVFQLSFTPAFHSNVQNQDQLGAHTTEQPYVDTCDFECTSKVVCGESLLSAVRKRVAHTRSNLQQQQQKQSNPRKRARGISMIEIPRAKHRRQSTFSEHSSIDYTSEENDSDKTQDNAMSNSDTENHSQHKNWAVDSQHHHGAIDQINRKHIDTKHTKKTNANTTPTGRPTRVKGPCQACQEASDGCMRKAFNWPFSTSQIFNDKGKPFVYLCNKCGLRYNKSNGCVCRHCRWVFCKEEKRKALQHIEVMRRKRPDGFIDPNEDIENFVCNPKYWTCGKPWKVGWVLNSLDEEDDEDALFAPLSQKL